METVQIAFATNIKFFKYTGIAIMSLAEHSDSNRQYEIHVLAEELPERDYSLLLKEISQYPNISISILNPQDILKGYSFYVRGHFSKETYYRLVLPELLPDVQKILYLDSDIIILDDVAKLYDEEIGDNLVAACLDPDTAGLYNGYELEKKEYTDKVLRLKDPYSYFQAGVMVFNLAMFRKSFTTRKILDYSASKKFQLLDQDILNKLCEGRVHFVDMSWNVMVDCGGFRVKEIIALAPEHLRKLYDQARKSPEIIHYAGPEKPWHYPEMDFSQEFWQYARKSPWYEAILWHMSQHAANEIHSYYKKNEKHPVKDQIEKVRVATLKVVPEDNPARVSFKNFVKKKILRTRTDGNEGQRPQWTPEVPEIFKR